VVQPATRDGRLSCAVAFLKNRPRNIETGNRLLGLLFTPPLQPSFDAWASSQLR
jgi:hypothetical protein